MEKLKITCKLPDSVKIFDVHLNTIDIELDINYRIYKHSEQFYANSLSFEPLPIPNSIENNYVIIVDETIGSIIKDQFFKLKFLT